MVRFQNVGMRYGLGPEVLSDITFDLAPGSFHFLTGPSGAGKTSLLRLMYLAHRPSRGRINMFGADVTTLKRRALPALRRRIGVVFQDFRLLDHLSALENVALPLRIAGARKDEVATHVTELLDWVGLGKQVHARPPTLSDGEKQRVAIARAVIGRPSLLLADEPTGNIDPDQGLRILRLFDELNKIGTTVVIATHDRTLVNRFGRPEMRLEDGALSLRPVLNPQPAAAMATAQGA
ncbi:MAG TPA: cell division ATP-binding protein FtsE [Alphaproteobacteria bacterium]|nr:cell division ATP-binding protein FtsE [Alphaproteobacteria bacterium]